MSLIGWEKKCHGSTGPPYEIKGEAVPRCYDRWTVVRHEASPETLNQPAFLYRHHHHSHVERHDGCGWGKRHRRGRFLFPAVRGFGSVRSTDDAKRKLDLAWSIYFVLASPYLHHGRGRRRLLVVRGERVARLGLVLVVLHPASGGDVQQQFRNRHVRKASKPISGTENERT